ncbi:MAG: hypothetical protein AAFQ42_11020 [Pseudomonadota bacterium]
MRQVLLFIILHVVFGGLLYGGWRLVRSLSRPFRLIGIACLVVGGLGLLILWYGAYV